MIDLIIKSVKDNDTCEKSKEFGYREGRKCKINLEYLQIGYNLMVFYPNESFFRTTPVKEINEDKYGYEVITQNRTYYFERTK